MIVEATFLFCVLPLKEISYLEILAPFFAVALVKATCKFDLFWTICWLLPVISTILELLSRYDNWEFKNVGFALIIDKVLVTVE